MRNSCVQPQHDGGYNPASTAAMAASATETAQHEQVPFKASKLFNKVVQPKLDNEDAVDMSSYFADWAPKRLTIIKKAGHGTTFEALRAEARAGQRKLASELC